VPAVGRMGRVLSACGLNRGSHAVIISMEVLPLILAPRSLHVSAVVACLLSRHTKSVSVSLPLSCLAVIVVMKHFHHACPRKLLVTSPDTSSGHRHCIQ
jgi:hypothetical protein